MRAIRRAGLPIKFSEGFNPHPKFSITKAVKLGIEFEDGEAIFELTQVVCQEDINKMISSQLPEGIKINKLNYV